MKSLLEFTNKEEIDCYLIFPDQCSKFSDFLKSYISTNFQINCRGIRYGKSLTQDLANEINQALSQTDIILMGYMEAISHDNCYKLGLAHAHSKQVILIDLSEGDTIKIPSFIRYKFFIKLGKEKSRVEILLQKLSKILSLIISKDIYGILYQKAIESCNEFNQITGIEIQVFTEREFIELIDKKRLNFYANLYLNDKNELRNILLNLATKNKECLFEYFSKFIQDSEKSSDLLRGEIMPENSKYNIQAEVVQIIEKNLGEINAKKYTNDPAFTEAITDTIEILARLQQYHPNATEAEAKDIIEAEFQEIKIKQPNKWETFRKQLLNRESWFNGGKAALSEAAKHYVDNNVFYKAGLAFLDSFSAN